MPNSILEIAIFKSVNQSRYIPQIKSGDYNDVRFILNPADANNELLQALEETNLSIELPLADCLDGLGNSCPTFAFTKLISQFPKGQKKSRLNIRRASFSFSKYNVSDLAGLFNWPTLQSLKLDYYIRLSNTKENSVEQRKYNDKQFFKDLADFIAKNQSITKLELSNYSFYSDYTRAVKQSVDSESLGLASYYPYGDYDQTHPEKARVTLEEPIKKQLLNAFKANYSLLDINIGEWSFIDAAFLQGILERNRIAAEQLRKAAKQGDTKKVEQLLKKGVSVFDADTEGNTALHYAAQNGFADIIKLLKNKQADWRMPNQKGETPISLAQQNDRYSIIALLTGKKYEAKVTPVMPVAKVNNKKEIIPPIPASEKNTSSQKMTMVNALSEVANEQSLYPKLEPFNSVVSTPSKVTPAAQKSCPFHNIMKSFGFFKSSQSTKAMVNATSKNTVNNSIELKEVIKKQPAPKLDNTQLAAEIADKAIDGAINGLDPISNHYPPNMEYDVFNTIEGLCSEAVFDAEQRKKLTALMVKLLKTPRQLLENVSALQKECLIRHLAIELQKNILVFKDTNDCDVEIVLNKDVKDSQKVRLLKETIHNAFADAYHRGVTSCVPSAPPLAMEDYSQKIDCDEQPIPVPYNASYMSASPV